MTNHQETLSQYLDAARSDNEHLDGLDIVIRAIALGATEIQGLVRDAATASVLGSTDEINVQGEIVQKLDSIASETFIRQFVDSGHVAAVGSEEEELGVMMGDDCSRTYVVLMDPLDGSSNIDVAVTIGSIFGIWHKEPTENLSSGTLLKRGNKQVASAYVIYGSSTVLVVATAGRVAGFTLNAKSGQFMLTHPNITIPAACEYYSFNEGNVDKWDENMQKAAAHLRKSYSQRYVGSLVADFHRNLLKGGVFLYPGDAKNKQGKLRLMYEANPLAFIAEQAGGKAFSDSIPILEVQPETIHQRVPLIIGNTSVVHTVLQFLGT